MKKAILWIITCVLILGGSVGIGCWLSMSEDMPDQKLDLSNPKHKKMLCGPVSLRNALGRLGIYCSLRELASQCEISSRGITLKELERVAGRIQGMKSRAKRLDWDGLKRLEGAAVLFVEGDHFVTADPRETPPSGSADSAAVRIYDEKKPAQWMTREELEKIWRGETLTIKRGKRSMRQAAAPHIMWESCFVDKGVVKPDSVERYSFAFRNVGDGDLTIDSVKKSCGCAKYTLARKRFAPGEAGVIEAEVDLKGKKGYFLNTLALKTNDPETPVSVLRMAAGALRARVLSAKLVNLGDLPAGGKLTREFFASDPGFDGLKVRDVSFVSTSEPEILKHLAFSITYDLLGDDVRRVAKLLGYRGKPEDYVIRFALKASEKCPVGRFQGTVIVVAEIGDTISTHVAMIKGAVVPDVQPVPGVALITLDEGGAGSTTIELHSRAKRQVQIVETWADSRVPVRIERADGPENPAGKFILSTSMPAAVPGAAPVESAAFFKLRDGTEVRVPIAIFKPPQS